MYDADIAQEILAGRGFDGEREYAEFEIAQLLLLTNVEVAKYRECLARKRIINVSVRSLPDTQGQHYFWHLTKETDLVHLIRVANMIRCGESVKQINRHFAKQRFKRLDVQVDLYMTNNLHVHPSYKIVSLISWAILLESANLQHESKLKGDALRIRVKRRLRCDDVEWQEAWEELKDAELALLHSGEVPKIEFLEHNITWGALVDNIYVYDNDDDLLQYYGLKRSNTHDPRNIRANIRSSAVSSPKSLRMALEGP